MNKNRYQQIMNRIQMPERCEQAENCMFYSYYKCSKQWKRLA